MSRIRPDKLLLPSVLDRLIDLDPDTRFESDNNSSVVERLEKQRS